MAIISKSSSNPLLKEKVFEKFDLTEEVRMTVEGTVNKTIISVVLTIATAAWIWSKVGEGTNFAYAIGAGLFAFVFAMITYFKPTWGAITVPIYAVLNGLFLGVISASIEAMYPGIVLQAVSLTFGTLFSMLFAYKAGWIKATEKFKSGIIAATGAIAFVYFFSFILSFFGTSVPLIHSSGMFGIGFSLVVIVIAALNFILDFDFIEQSAAQGAPKYMEWMGALGLLVTLIWLYIEFLRLLSKLRND